MARPDSGSDSSDLIVILIFLAVIAFAIAGVYDTYRSEINSVFVAINKAQIAAFAPFNDKAKWFHDGVGQADPGRFSIEQIYGHFEFVGQYLRWVTLPVMFVLGWILWVRAGVAENYRRVLNLKGLLREQIHEFPCLAPVIDRDLHDEPYDEGPWRTLRQPIQWAAEHHLLMDARTHQPVPKKQLIGKDGVANLRSELIERMNRKRKIFAEVDRDKVRRLFVAQVGPRFKGWHAVPVYIRGLAAAFMAFGHGDRETAYKLLDKMSLSFVEPRPGRPSRVTWKWPFYTKPVPEAVFSIDSTGAKALIAKYWDSEEMLPFIEAHDAYLYPLMVALFRFAHEKGVLQTAEFIWLRPTNLTLFAALNQEGGREPWIEAAGVWSHLDAEEAIGAPIQEPQVDMAVEGFVDRLYDDGWLPEDEE